MNEKEENRDEDGEKIAALQVMVKDFKLIHLNLQVIVVTERFLIRNKMWFAGYWKTMLSYFSKIINWGKSRNQNTN